MRIPHDDPWEGDVAWIWQLFLTPSTSWKPCTCIKRTFLHCAICTALNMHWIKYALHKHSSMRCTTMQCHCVLYYALLYTLKITSVHCVLCYWSFSLNVHNEFRQFFQSFKILFHLIALTSFLFWKCISHDCIAWHCNRFACQCSCQREACPKSCRHKTVKELCSG